MSFSPALAHRQRKMAAISAGTTAAAALPEIDDANPAAAEYRQLLAALHEDQRTLKDIQSVQEKIARKAGMIAAYLPWVMGALDAGEEGQAVQDEIVVTIMIWALDLQNWPLALDLGQHVLKHRLALPERFERTPACLIAEEIADAAKVDIEAVPYDVLVQALALSLGHDMPDQVKAKLLRAIGLNLADQADKFDPSAESAVAGGKAALIDAALSQLKEAKKFYKNVGVTKTIEKLERDAKKLAEEAGTKQN